MSKKISELGSKTKLAANDKLVIVDSEEATLSNKNKEVTFSDFEASLAIPDSGNIDLWDGLTEYVPGPPETFVVYGNNLWRFVSTSNNTGTTPGTNTSIWQTVSTGVMAHQQNTDTMLARGKSSQIAATQIAKPISSVYADVNNAGTTNTVLFAATVGGKNWTTAGAFIRFTFSGKTAANTNSKTFNVKLGTAVVFNSGSITTSGFNWTIETKIYRTTNLTGENVRGVTEFRTDSASITPKITHWSGTDVAIGDTSLTFFLYGQGAATNDITLTSGFGDSVNSI